MLGRGNEFREGSLDVSYLNEETVNTYISENGPKISYINQFLNR